MKNERNYKTFISKEDLEIEGNNTAKVTDTTAKQSEPEAINEQIAFTQTNENTQPPLQQETPKNVFQGNINTPPLQEQPQKKKSNAKIWIIAGSVVAMLLVSIGGYFAFFKKDRIDIFDYIDISVTGTNNHGKIEIEPSFTDDTKYSTLADMIDYEILNHENGTLANGDEVEIFIDKNQQVLKKNKIALTSDTYAFTVEGLIIIPVNYSDILDPSSILDKANENVKLYEESRKKGLEASAQTQFGISIPTTIQTNLMETWYIGNEASSYCDFIYQKLACGSVAYVYKMNASVSSNEYYLTNPDVYFVQVYTGIHYDEENKLQATAYTDAMLIQETDLVNIENKLTELGFIKL